MTKSFKVGDSATFTRVITDEDIHTFAALSGDDNPVHLDDEYAATTRFGQRIAHGMLTASLISTVLGTKLPGPGAIYLSQVLRFQAPVFPGDTITAEATITAYDQSRRRMTMKTSCRNQDGKVVLVGDAELLV